MSFYSSQRHLEILSDLAVRQTSKVSEVQRLALLTVEPTHRFSDGAPSFVCQDLFARVLAGLDAMYLTGSFLHGDLRLLNACCRRSEPINGTAPGQGKQISMATPFEVIESLGLPPKFQKNVRDNRFGFDLNRSSR